MTVNRHLDRTLAEHSVAKKTELQAPTTEEAEDPNSEEQPGEHLIGSLYKRYNRPIYNFFANSGFTREESRDLTQETFLQAYRCLDSFRGHSRAPTWLFGIAKNIWLEEFRNRGRLKRKAETLSLEQMTTEGQGYTGQSSLEHHAERREILSGLLEEERSRMLREAISYLPERMRLCVFLHFIQERKSPEIAALLGISEKTVRSQLSQARVRLREMLAEHFPELF